VNQVSPCAPCVFCTVSRYKIAVKIPPSPPFSPLLPPPPLLMRRRV
jgi:hypothetical protein